MFQKSLCWEGILSCRDTDSWAIRGSWYIKTQTTKESRGKKETEKKFHTQVRTERERGDTVECMVGETEVDVLTLCYTTCRDQCTGQKVDHYVL